MTMHSKPAAALSHPVDSQAFRDTMSRLAAAVTIVTTDGPAGAAGFTATAVAPVSDRPASLLVCVNRASRSHGAVEANGVLCVNVLGDDMAELADIFAGRGDLAHAEDTASARFARGEWTRLRTGAPVLRGAIAVFDCRITEIAAISTHDVVIGEVVAVTTEPDARPLVHCDRAYHGLER